MNCNIPNFLKEMLNKQYGELLTEKIIQGYSQKRHTTFRVNNLKSNTDEIEKVLKKEKVDYEKVTWYENAYILNNIETSEIRKLDIYSQGKIYMQSLSSMLPPIILEPKVGNDILDMTAAPGGKTTEIAALTNNKSNITACEKNKIRADRLKYNIQKQGANVYVMNEDATKIDDFFSFDQILLDAPCSGSGVLNLNDNLNEKFTKKLIDKSVDSQTKLLNKALNILKKGKEMVYSTCSILDVENEKIIDKIVKEKIAEVVPIQFKGMEEISQLPTKIKGTMCVCPDKHYEGFFMAKLRKI